jgi:Xaa-Pro dipeptidase
MRKKDKTPEFVPIDKKDLDPGHRWHRPLQAPGITQVDFEERVNFPRLHRYRLARTRQSLAKSGFGAMLCFDQHNIRYISSTVIGEWARDKLIRYCLLTGTGEPWVWDFGSAARHHKLYCPWIHEDHVHAGNPGMRGAIGPEVGLFEAAAKQIKDILAKEGVAGMPLGLDVCEPGMLFALQDQGLEIRDGQQMMLAAREVKSHDEITLLNTAAAMVDGVYQDITEALKPEVELLPSGYPAQAVASKTSIEESSGRFVVFIETGFWRDNGGESPVEVVRHRIADYATRRDAEVAAAWIERGAERDRRSPPTGV